MSRDEAQSYVHANAETWIRHACAHTHTTHAYTWMTCHELTSYVHANTYTCRRRGYTLMTCHEPTEHVHATTDMTHTHTYDMYACHHIYMQFMASAHRIRAYHQTQTHTHTHTRHVHYFIRACQHVCMCTHTHNSCIYVDDMPRAHFIRACQHIYMP